MRARLIVALLGLLFVIGAVIAGFWRVDGTLTGMAGLIGLIMVIIAIAPPNSPPRRSIDILDPDEDGR